MSPLQFVTRERITRAQQLIRAVTAARQRPGFPTSHSLIEIALEVGYTSPAISRKSSGVSSA